jgi:hypothetical protein
MKYTRIIREQFEALHLEFANFLASQSIDKNEWDTLKRDIPEVAEQELDVFSDLIWEGVLKQAKYLDHYSKNLIFLFECLENEMMSIVISIHDEAIDLMTAKGLEWLVTNLMDEKVIIQKGIKAYDKPRNEVIFDVIQQGAVLSKGEFYNDLMQLFQ